jgi:hypothetical protein
MSYKKFKGKDIENLGYQINYVNLFDNPIQLIEPSKIILDYLEYAKELNPYSEKAVCEMVIAPVFIEIKKRNVNKIDVYSGEHLNVDSVIGLNGEIDFIITKYSGIKEITMPIFCTSEAKIGKVESHFSQIIAQMIGAYQFNQKQKSEITTVYGCITDGFKWRFLKLADKIIYIDTEIISFKELSLILGRLQWIVDFYTK